MVQGYFRLPWNTPFLQAREMTVFLSRSLKVTRDVKTLNKLTLPQKKTQFFKTLKREMINKGRVHVNVSLLFLSSYTHGGLRAAAAFLRSRIGLGPQSEQPENSRKVSPLEVNGAAQREPASRHDVRGGGAGWVFFGGGGLHSLRVSWGPRVAHWLTHPQHTHSYSSHIRVNWYRLPV